MTEQTQLIKSPWSVGERLLTIDGAFLVDTAPNFSERMEELITSTLENYSMPELIRGVTVSEVQVVKRRFVQLTWKNGMFTARPVSSFDAPLYRAVRYVKPDDTFELVLIPETGTPIRLTARDSLPFHQVFGELAPGRQIVQVRALHEDNVWVVTEVLDDNND